MNNPTTTCADVMEAFMSKLFKPKTRIEASDIISLVDDLGRLIQIYYRVVDGVESPQSDNDMDCYTVEQVLYNGRKVKLTGHGEQEILEWLNINNPAKI